MTLKEQLRAALDLLGPNGEHWCQGQYARDAEGDEASPFSIFARKWCSIGALQRVGAPSNAYQYFNLPGGEVMWTFNDTPGRTFPEVKALFERAIAAAE